MFVLALFISTGILLVALFFWSRLSLLLRRSLLWISVLLTVLCLINFGVLWTLLPLVLGMTTLGVALFGRFEKIHWSVKTVFVICFVASVVANILAPIPNMPAPSGPYQVGVRYHQFVSDVPEMFTPQLEDFRTLYLKIWYPASSVEGTSRNPMFEGPDYFATELAQMLRIHIFFTRQLKLVKTHGFNNVSVAEGQFPLLVFSHGYGSWFAQNTTLMEELASRGFVVAAVANTNQTAFAATGPDAVVRFDSVYSLTPKEEEPENVPDSLVKYMTAQEYNNNPDFFDGMQKGAGYTNLCANSWGLNISAVIDEMIESSADLEVFAGKLDTTRIGVFGMSFGGAASREAAIMDSRIKAAANLDGWPYGIHTADSMRVPFLTLEGEHNFAFDNDSTKSEGKTLSMYTTVAKRTTAPYYTIRYPDAYHIDFSDLGILLPGFKWLGMLGPVDKKFFNASMRQVISEYFEACFSNKPFDTQQYGIVY